MACFYSWLFQLFQTNLENDQVQHEKFQGTLAGFGSGIRRPPSSWLCLWVVEKFVESLEGEDGAQPGQPCEAAQLQELGGCLLREAVTCQNCLAMERKVKARPVYPPGLPHDFCKD